MGKIACRAEFRSLPLVARFHMASQSHAMAFPLSSPLPLMLYIISGGGGLCLVLDAVPSKGGHCCVFRGGVN